MQPLRGDPDNLLLEGTIATEEGKHLTVSVPLTCQGEGLLLPFFHKREAPLRWPPIFCFIATDIETNPGPNFYATGLPGPPRHLTTAFVRSIFKAKVMQE